MSANRFWIFILALGLAASLFGGCCSQVDCIGSMLPGAFATSHFDSLSILNSRIELLDKQTHTLVDTGRIQSIYRASGAGKYQANFYTKYQYRQVADQFYLRLLVARRDTHIISEVFFKDEGCNSCFPSRPKSDYYKTISGYRIDGVAKEGYVVELD